MVPFVACFKNFSVANALLWYLPQCQHKILIVNSSVFLRNHNSVCGTVKCTDLKSIYQSVATNFVTYFSKKPSNRVKVPIRTYYGKFDFSIN